DHRCDAHDHLAPLSAQAFCPAARNRAWALALSVSSSAELSCCRACSTSISSPSSADSASTRTASAVTDKKPPCTAAPTCSPSVVVMDTTPPSTSWPNMGWWPGRIPISPSVVWATTKFALPDHSRRSTATSSTVISATATPRNSSGRSGRVYLVRREPRASLGQLAVLLLQVVQTTDAQERLLRVVVVLALGDLVERLDGLAQRHRRTGDAG